MRTQLIRFIWSLLILNTSAALSFALAPEYTTETFSLSRYGTKASASYPVFSQYQALNSHVKDYVLACYDTFIESAQETAISASRAESTFSASCREISANSSYISVLMSISTYYSGAPHGRTELTSFNYDIKNSCFFRITDIPGITYEGLHSYCRQKVEEEIYRDFQIEPDEFMLESGTAPDPANYAVFTFDGNNVTVYFQQYQVGPYSFGIISVPLTPHDLSGEGFQGARHSIRKPVKTPV